MNEELRAIGQSQARWGALYWIDVFGDTVNQTQLAERMGIEQPTLGRVLDGLERDGLIERRSREGDQRSRVIRLTRAARPVLKEIARIGNAVSRRLLEGIPQRDLAICVAVFAQILDNFEEG
jgi:MarR family transcriptional regulator for hemolysin